jgi:D-alanyl-D-alanine carboxypeptidase
MKQLFVAVLSLGFLVSVLDAPQAVSSSVASVTLAPSLKVTDMSEFSVTAKAYSIIDIETGKILFAKNDATELPIASVTKLFTAAAVLEQSTDKVVTITAADVATEGRSGKLAVGQRYSTHELLFPLLLESSNDAAVALDRLVGPVRFSNDVLADPAGLSSANRATAAELAAEVRQLYLTEPHLFDITRLSQYIGTETGWINNSPVRQLTGYRGGKHGYTEAAGKTLAAVFSESIVGEREFGYILLGSKDLLADVTTLREGVARSIRVE